MATQYTAGLTSGQTLTAAIMNQIGAAWETYTPTVTAGSGTITTVGTRNAKYMRIQKMVIVNYDITITTNGTGALWISLTKPITSVAALGGTTGLVGMGLETAVTGNTQTIRDYSTTTVILQNIGGAYPGGNGYRLTGFFIYEAA